MCCIYFSSQSLTYLHNSIWPCITTITRRGRVFVCLPMCKKYFANGGYFLYNMRDAEYVSEAALFTFSSAQFPTNSKAKVEFYIVSRN